MNFSTAESQLKCRAIRCRCRCDVGLASSPRVHGTCAAAFPSRARVRALALSHARAALSPPSRTSIDSHLHDLLHHPQFIASVRL